MNKPFASDAVDPPKRIDDPKPTAALRTSGDLSRYRFSLQKMLLAIAALSVVLGGVRWWQVNYLSQRNSVLALREYGCEAVGEYGGRVFDSWNPSPQLVKAVHLRVPFAADEDAERVNALIRRLPHVTSVTIESSAPKGSGNDSANASLADQHAAAAIAGIPLEGFIARRLLTGGRTVAESLRTKELRAVNFYGDTPAAADIRALVEKIGVHFMRIDKPDAETLSVLAGAKWLSFVELTEPDVSGLPALTVPHRFNVSLKLSSVADEDLRVIGRIPNLVYLEVRGGTATEDGVRALSECPKLERLSLQYLRYGDSALNAGAWPKVELLSVVGSDVTAEGVITFAQGRKPGCIRINRDLDVQRIKAACPTMQFISDYVDPAELAKRNQSQP